MNNLKNVSIDELLKFPGQNKEEVNLLKKAGIKTFYDLFETNIIELEAKLKYFMSGFKSEKSAKRNLGILINRINYIKKYINSINPGKMVYNYRHYDGIKIDDLKDYFSPNLRKYLVKVNINSLKELFEMSEKIDFIFMGTESTNEELLGTVRLLRCKYLGENPNVDILSVTETISPLSTKSKRLIEETSSHNFILEIIGKGNLNEFRNIKKNVLYNKKEILSKYKILYTYYVEYGNVHITTTDYAEKANDLMDELEILLDKQRKINQRLRKNVKEIKGVLK